MADRPPHRQPRTVLKHLGLFLLTFVSVTFTGVMWVGESAGDATFWSMVPEGALFASLLLAFLGVHEFGHYIAALAHHLRVTLPYFIPVPFGIGTMGAIIRIREPIRTNVALFDMGISGPLAGFVVSLILLAAGFLTLPDPTFIGRFAGHEAILEVIERTGAFPDEPVAPGMAPAAGVPDDAPETAPGDASEIRGDEASASASGEVVVIGNTLLYSLLASFFADAPPMFEMYHYPFLFAGWLGLFFTALNLMPFGQLDGGHILYALVGRERHRTIARVLFAILATLGGVEAVPLFTLTLMDLAPDYYLMSFVIWAFVLLSLLRRAYDRDHRWVFPVWILSLGATVVWLLAVLGSLTESGSLIWLVWSFFIVYMVRLDHPPTLIVQPLDPTRRILGWASMIILILCFSFQPITLF